MDHQHILDFWFGPLDENGAPKENRFPLWFESNPKTDQTIKERFADDLAKAKQGDLHHWADTAKGRLALIVVLDQFTRNIYRGSGEAFASDHLARDLSATGIDCGHDKQLGVYERAFFYMPLEHSESMADQDRCIEVFTSLKEEARPAVQEAATRFLDFAHSHRAIIERFGRYPHRNVLLDRPSTPEELAWLNEGGETFGQSK